ncbi:septum formation family protein [Streptomyces sp. NBC_01754]|uniref:septum formation family protein n=1 Tax=Streptomyces sp. NBC_01754 TaxID=2975930 RepID=UPI002DDB1D7F|nr:septum formation family protein [Streptomyces sp. NBC_01754]WSC95992.1 septum formation family protein [Streptomyces sp. NBC_01754]
MSIGVKSRSLRGIAAVVALLAVGTAGCADVVEGAKAGAKKAVRQRSVFSLSTGDCYNPNSGVTDTEEFSVEVVPCEEAHEGQVVGEFKIEGESKYPGEDATSEIADERCPAVAQKFASDTWSVPEGVGLFYYLPTSESWKTGDRAVSCTYAKEKGTFSGSLKSEGLNSDQLAYLKGSNALYDTLWANQPEADHVEDDFDGYKKQAEAVGTALDTHLASLKGIQQPEAVKLHKELEGAAKAWKKAASAKDTDAFYVAYDLAFTGIDPNKTVAARKELELATTVPADDAEVWAD